MINSKPLNVWSRDEEEIGRLLSNFAHTPFVLDDIAYESIEGFYASILLEHNVEKQQRARGLHGMKAKRCVPKNKPESFNYRDEVIMLGSAEHHELLKRALRAKLEAHPEIAEAFIETRPRPVIHETGYPHNPDAEFSHLVFCRILTELRDEFADEPESSKN
ncbi:MAG: hypothetical protein AAGH89_17230 [Verrucomicrobiota bacterium]